MFKKLSRKELLRSIDEGNEMIVSIVESLEKENEKLRFRNKKKEIILKEIQNCIKESGLE